MFSHTLSIIAGIVLGGIGFLFFGTVLTRVLEEIETINLIVFGVLAIFFAVIVQIYDRKHTRNETKNQIHEVTGTINGEHL